MSVTINDVAKRAGVSIATVSRVIHGAETVNEQLGLNVRKAIAELGYVPNSIAQSLKQNCSRMIGITASDLSVSFFPEVVKGVEKAFLSRGYATTVSSTYDRPENEEIILRQMLSRRVDALLVNSTGQNEDLLHQIALAGTPVIFYDRRPRSHAFPAVYADKKQSMYIALEHLTGVGHKRVMLATGPRMLNSNYDRYMGVQRFIFDKEKDPADYSYHFGEFSYAEGMVAMEEISQLDAAKRPTAVITGSIAITSGIMAYCRRNGWRIPDDIAIVSSGDFMYADLMDLKLTYLDDRVNDISDAIVEQLEGCLNGEPPQNREVALKPILYLGNTSGGALNRAAR